MGVITGLNAIREAIDSRPQSFENVSDRELTRNIEKNGERTIRFIQELDESSSLYNESLGLGIVVLEYQHPELYWFRVCDTADEEGECWAAEQGWDSKMTLYINVQDVNSGEIFYLGRSVYGGLGQQIVDSATERGTLTDAVWKIKKTGEGMKTRYSLNLISLEDSAIEVDTDKMIDFRKNVIREIPSGEQEAAVRQVEQRVKAKNQETDSSDDELAW